MECEPSEIQRTFVADAALEANGPADRQGDGSF